MTSSDCSAHDLLQPTPAGPLGGGKGEHILEQGPLPVVLGLLGGVRVRQEATLTTDKDFKRLVRNRSARTGESYSAARRRLLERRGATMVVPPLRRVDKSDLGFAVHVPVDWFEQQPQATNSEYEVARFARPSGDARGLCLVFRWGDLTEDATVWSVASTVRVILEGEGYEHFVLSDAQFAGRPSIRLACDKELPFGLWTVREEFVVDKLVAYVLGMGTNDPERDQPLLDEMANRFELLL